jgi:long-chain acyl-CoA synthetase
MITHRNILSNISSLLLHSDDALKFEAGDKHMSYLPAAHSFERTAGSSMIAQGGSIGFFRGDVLKLLEDAEALQPTDFPIVPRLANKIFDVVSATINESRITRRKLFWYAYSVKLANWKKYKKIEHPLFDRLIFAKVKARLGGKVRLIVTGR